MSLGLVAYDASDDSENDEENVDGNDSHENDGNPSSSSSFSTLTGKQQNDKMGKELQTDSSKNLYTITTESRSSPVSNSGFISDEDEFETVSTSTTSAALIGSSSGLSNKSDPLSKPTTIKSLGDLPEPQPRQNQNFGGIDEEGELEEEVKPKSIEIENAPKPPGKKTRQPVKITIPSLNQVSDEDEHKPKRSASSKPSGLFALLPSPIHSSKKEVNRPLIPHTLTKKPAVSSTIKKPLTSQPKSNTLEEENKNILTTTSSSKRMSHFNALTGYDSDSDDEPEVNESVNFFSLGSSDNNKAKSSNPILASTSTSSTNSTPSNLQIKEVDSTSLDKQKDVNEDGVMEEEHAPVCEPGSTNDAPLFFGKNAVQNTGVSSSSSSYHNYVGPSGPVHYISEPSAYSNSFYNLAHSEASDVVPNHDEVPSSDLKQFMSDKEFQRLQGKRKRGLEDNITFVDANVDDYVDPSEVSKHFTEETEYVSHKAKDNQPTQQQRKKKQITYLAFQAKERELELKNQWAMNRQTKKQTQSKYGF